MRASVSRVGGVAFIALALVRRSVDVGIVLDQGGGCVPPIGKPAPPPSPSAAE